MPNFPTKFPGALATAQEMYEDEALVVQEVAAIEVALGVNLSKIGFGLGSNPIVTWDPTTQSFQILSGTKAVNGFAAGANGVGIIGKDASGSSFLPGTNGIFLAATEPNAQVDLTADKNVITTSVNGAVIIQTNTQFNLSVGPNAQNSPNAEIAVDGASGAIGISTFSPSGPITIRANGEAQLNGAAGVQLGSSGGIAVVSGNLGTKIGTDPALLIGFYGSSGAAKPVVAGDKTANLKAVVTSLLAALSALGLVTDSTT